MEGVGVKPGQGSPKLAGTPAVERDHPKSRSSRDPEEAGDSLPLAPADHSSGLMSRASRAALGQAQGGGQEAWETPGRCLWVAGVG